VWLKARLAADADLAGLVKGRIYDSEMPPETAYPAVIFELYEPDEAQTANREVIFARPQFLVKGVDAASQWSNVDQVAERIQALLHLAPGDGEHILGCVRETPFAYAESDGTKRYRHAGGVYRVFVKG
jgi:hypothetical protein